LQKNKGKWVRRPGYMKEVASTRKLSSPNLPKALMPMLHALKGIQFRQEAAQLRSYTDKLAERWGISQEEALGMFGRYVSERPTPWQECRAGFETENLWRG
jgi:hypothetical protein